MITSYLEPPSSDAVALLFFTDLSYCNNCLANVKCTWVVLFRTLSSGWISVHLWVKLKLFPGKYVPDTIHSEKVKRLSTLQQTLHFTVLHFAELLYSGVLTMRDKMPRTCCFEANCTKKTDGKEGIIQKEKGENE